MAIKKLSEFEHIRLRPGPYIGCKETPIHLLYELIDNAADECITGNSDSMIVILNYDEDWYSVADTGRGIPIISKDYSEELPVLISTQLFTGGKFDNDLYTHRSGLHGEGLVIVNALSDWFEIVTKNGNNHRRYYFDNTNLKKPKRIIEDVDKKMFSTKVSFKPSKTFFESIKIDRNDVMRRLQAILVYNGSNISIKLLIIENGDRKLIEIQNNIEESFVNACTNYCVTEIESKPIVDYTTKGKPKYAKHKDYLKLYIGFSNETTTRMFRSVINTLNVEQGTHQKLIENNLKEYLFERSEKDKRHTHKEDMLIGCRILAIMKLTDPSFSGQTKYALDVSKTKLEHLINEKIIKNILENNKDFVNQWIEYAEAHRIQMDSKRSMNKRRKSRNIILVDGLKDCTSNDVTERELFILEGKSAGGTLQLSRDVKRHAILPLRGKILNVMSAQAAKIMRNKTLMDIFTAINVKPFVTTTTDNVRYDKIVIMTDADYDGLHIAALLLSLFEKCTPSVIDNGHLYVAETPLFGCYKRKKFVPIYDDNELESYRKTDTKIFRFKGLGEMQPAELATCVLDPSTRRLIQVTRDIDSSVLENMWKNKQGFLNNYLDIN